MSRLTNFIKGLDIDKTHKKQLYDNASNITYAEINSIVYPPDLDVFNIAISNNPPPFQILKLKVSPNEFSMVATIDFIKILYSCMAIIYEDLDFYEHELYPRINSLYYKGLSDIRKLEKNGNDTVNFNNIGTDLNDDHAILSVVFDITKISDKEYSIDCGIDKLSLK